MKEDLVVEPQSNEGKIVDLIYSSLWKYKKVNVLILVIFSIASVMYALSLPNVYQSNAQLIPAKEDNAGGLSGMLGQLGGLASVAGINIGSSGKSEFQLEEMLRSRDFIITFINKYDLKKELFASNGWDMSSNELLYDDEIFDVKTQKWVREVKFPKSQIPSNEEAYEKFREVFKVILNKKKRLFKLTFESYSPEKSKEWLELYINDFNSFMKERDVVETTKNLDFLNKYAVESKNSELQITLYNLIEEQLKVLMLTKSKDNYALEVIQSPFVPEKKHAPKRAFICLAGLFLGGVLALCLSVFRFINYRSN